jgi:GntR family transcriptional repressor for pyruvate dehydrogenase complex
MGVPAPESPGPGAPTDTDDAGGRRSIPIAPGDGLRRAPKKAEIVARALVRDIVNKGRQPGAALASESEMVDEYGVSRESIREALRLLEVQGLVTIRRGPGGGPSVCTVDPANLGRMSALYYQLAGATYRELFEAWVLTEELLAQRAARNPNPQARVTAMTPYLLDGDAVPHPGHDIESFMRDHMSFHWHVASLGRNRVLELSLQVMGQIVSHHVEVTDDPRAMGRDLDEDHRRIAAAIVAGGGDRAAALMKEHVAGMASTAGEHLGHRLDDVIEWQ